METKKSFLIEQLISFKSDGEKIQSDDILTMFVEYVESLGIELYPAQEEAVLELLAWKHVVLNTPTGSGKSLVALAFHFQALCTGKISYYTAPTKALVNEKFFSLCDVFGPENVGLLTGDASVNSLAPIICCTAEILSNQALRQDNIEIDCVVMDEFHYYGDKERGVAWQIPLITMKDTVFLLMSATLGDMGQVVQRLKDYTKRDVAFLRNVQRPVPLEFTYKEEAVQDVVENLIKEGNSPVYLVSFTQKDSALQASNLMSIDVCSKEDKKEIAHLIEDVKFDTPYGKEFSRFLRHGIGVHHAGLLPKYRRVVEKLAQKGLVKVISGTDTLGVGVNIPIKTVVIRQLYKYNGEKNVIVSAREFHQVAGRAGRKGFDDKGLVVILAPQWVVENKKREQKLLKNPHLKKKIRKVSPPPSSLPWDQETTDRLIKANPEPLEPQFEITHGMIINLLQGGQGSSCGGYGRLLDLIYRSHGSDKEKSLRRKKAAQLFRSLRQAGIVILEKLPDGSGSKILLSQDLQKDFSLNNSLSLYLVETIDLLEKNEEHALGMLTLVESILENPMQVIYKQIDKAKGELVGRLKAEGVPYEERMEELEKVTHPMPMKEFIRETFIAFSQSHPWVGNEHIRPKSIAREIYENCYDFNYYVSSYGLARSEGVLLRYLSQVYKVAVQNVPSSMWTEEFEDILSYFHGMVRRVDSSMIEEWSLLMNKPIEEDTIEQVKIPSVADDPRVFKVRMRNEMHAFLGLVAKKDWQQAVMCLYHSESFSYEPSDIEKMMESYFALYDIIDLTPAARMAHNTLIIQEEHRLWKIHQKIIDPEGNDDRAIECRVDLRVPKDEREPLIELININV